MDPLTIENPCKPRLERRCDGQLWLTTDDGETTAVRISRCFPWSARSRFISLRDDERRERWLIENPETLDLAGALARIGAHEWQLDLTPTVEHLLAEGATLEDALVEADFVLELTSIASIDEEIEIRCWDVETSQGRRRFQTRRDDWPRRVPGGGA